MKQFFCGDVVPGCTAVFDDRDEEQILENAASNTDQGLGLKGVSSELVEKMRSLKQNDSAA